MLATALAVNCDNLSKIFISGGNRFSREGLRVIINGMGLKCEICMVDGLQQITDLTGQEIVIHDSTMENAKYVRMDTLLKYDKVVYIVNKNTGDGYVLELLKNGVRGILDEKTNSQEISECIEAMWQNKIFVPHRMCLGLLTMLLRSSSMRVENLSNSQRKLIKLVANGATRNEICEAMGVKYPTLVVYLSNVRRKLHIPKEMSLYEYITKHPEFMMDRHT